MQIDQTPQTNHVDQHNNYDDDTLVVTQIWTDIPSELQPLWLSALMGHLDQWYNAQEQTSPDLNQRFEDLNKNLDQCFAVADRHDDIIEQHSRKLKQQSKQMQTVMEPKRRSYRLDSKHRTWLYNKSSRNRRSSLKGRRACTNSRS